MDWGFRRMQGVADVFVLLYNTSLACVESVQDHCITSMPPMLTFCDGGRGGAVSSGAFHVGPQLKILLPSLTGGVDYRRASGLIPT